MNQVTPSIKNQISEIETDYRTAYYRQLRNQYFSYREKHYSQGSLCGGGSDRNQCGESKCICRFYDRKIVKDWGGIVNKTVALLRR